MRRKGILAAAMAFAASPQGRRLIQQGRAYIRSPQGKRKIAELRGQFRRRPAYTSPSPPYPPPSSPTV